MKKKKKPKFNKHEKLILRAIHRERRPMTIHEIKEKTGISWVTIRKYLRKLEKRKFVFRGKEGERYYWSLIYNFIEKGPV